jgi:prepilin-type N-terminal cleavage/methylation domain-containing protein
MFLLKNNKLSDTQPSINKSSKNNSRKIQAFSLIELSIVILIIGILVAGVTSSSRLITRMKVITAQNLTRNSPVASIKDLAVWYETSLDESFDNAEETEDSPITNWFDLNPQSSFKINSNQATVDNKPKFKTNIFNGLPGILFDGSNDFMLSSAVGISGKGLSIFVVAQRKAFATTQGILSGTYSTTTSDEANSSGGFQAFYDTNAGTYASLCSGVWYTVISQTTPRDGFPFIVSTIFSGTSNTGYLNNIVGSTVNGSPNFFVDRLYLGSRYVNAPTQFFNGHIAEIIIFNRGLNTEERLAVNAYLSKKYAIKTS